MDDDNQTKVMEKAGLPGHGYVSPELEHALCRLEANGGYRPASAE